MTDPQKNAHNVVLTGVPRSGTTLTCHLLNKIANTVALHEPIEWDKLSAIDRRSVCETIDKFFDSSRTSLLDKKQAPSQQLNGVVPDNPFEKHRIWKNLVPKRLLDFRLGRKIGLRSYQVSRGVVNVATSLDQDFLLCVKHVGPFMAVIDELIQNYRCFAIIRNPLPVLLSWNSIDFQLRDGHFSMVERLDPELSNRLAMCEDRLDRQVVLLSWFFEKIDAHVPKTNIIRYEDITASGGRALTVITHQAMELSESLHDKNRDVPYDKELANALAMKLRDNDGAFWNFYSRESILSGHQPR